MACRVFDLPCGVWTLSCGLWDLVPWPGMESRPPALGAQVLATGPPGKSPERSLSSHQKACLSCTKNSRSKLNYLQKCDSIALLYATSQYCCWKGETILVLNTLNLTFFSFPLGPCRIFSFPRYSKIHNNFPMWESVFIYCTEQSACSFKLSNLLLVASLSFQNSYYVGVILSRPVLWFPPVFYLFIFAFWGDDFFNFQPVCWVFISVIVLNFLFSSINSWVFFFFMHSVLFSCVTFSQSSEKKITFFGNYLLPSRPLFPPCCLLFVGLLWTLSFL